MACIPLYAGTAGIGVLAASTYMDRLMDDRTLNCLVRISGQMALGIERAHKERTLVKEREKALAQLTAMGEDIGRTVSGAVEALEAAVRQDRHNIHAERSLAILKDSLPVLDSVKKLTSSAPIMPVRQAIDAETVLTACAASVARCGGRRITIACEGEGGEVYASPLLKDMLAYVFDCIVKCAPNDVDVKAGISPGFHDGKKHIRVSIEYGMPCPDIAMARALAGKYGIKLWLEKENGKERAVMLLPAA